MSDDDAYYEFQHATPLSDARELRIPRALELYDAVMQHREFCLIGLARITRDEASVECLTVEVTCDGVPSRNPYGLRYRERLALIVGTARDVIPSVLALRKGFPRLVHQNSYAPNSPANLCLYFEPTSTVLRTWTPASFLNRILWWFEKNARGELHLADQPLDHLFFASKYQLLLPWNLNDIRKNSPELVVARGNERTDGGLTHYLLPTIPDRKVTTALLIEVNLPSILHGSVEVDPVTLGQLADLLTVRQVDLLPLLQNEFRSLVDANGKPVRRGKPFTIILLHIPICREEGSAPESTGQRAFLLSDDPFDLGVLTGALMLHENKFYSAEGLLGESTEQRAKWRNQPIAAMEILRENTPADARKQSGIATPGPIGVVVGAGSIGSALINLWGRSGWGQWSVIDKDYIRPHNLSRHTAQAHQVGLMKVAAVADLHLAMSNGASKINPIEASACDEKNEAVIQALKKADVIIDASAGLEYPRYASQKDSLPRHVSAFITPSANAGVVLAEDACRAYRLRTLEAQYYRAMLKHDWGRDHLKGNMGSFWSGASCRDLSMVLPYAKVMSHACLFAEHLPRLLDVSEPIIRIWHHGDERGSLAVHDVTIHSEHSKTLGNLTVFWDMGLEQELRSFRNEHAPNETGGVLLGYYDFNVNALVLVAGYPAPPDSVATRVSFERGIEGLKDYIEEASRRTSGIVRYVGEWHSHPPGNDASPSEDDLFQIINIALAMGDEGLPGVQMIIGEHDLSIAMSERAL